MNVPDELKVILDRIANHHQSEVDIAVLRQWLSSDSQIVTQTGKYAVNLGEGQDIHVGDRIYQGAGAEAIWEIVRSIFQELRGSDQSSVAQGALEGQSFKASPEGIQKAKQAMKNQVLSEDKLAEKANVPRLTVLSFLGSELVDKQLFIQISQQLDLDWQKIADDIDDIVLEVRQKVNPYIQERCGKMRVLDMEQPIGLTAIYTSVNILRKITGRRRLGIKELLGNYNLEEFDRFGLAAVPEKRLPGLDAVQLHNKMIVLGKPGAGKTTFLKYLAVQCNKGQLQAERVPIFIALKDFAEAKGSPGLLEYINQQFAECHIENSQIAEKLLRRGRCLLLLDGLDEVREIDHDRVLQEIRQFSTRFSQCQFVMTCRIAAREYTFEQFTEVEVADFDWQQIIDFATKWFQAKADLVKAEKFIQRLEENEPIRELATNPLLLTLLCLVFEDSADFPANRSELYKEGLDVLLKKWDAKRNIERDQVYKKLSLQRKQDLLSQIAFSTFNRSEYFFKQKAVEQQITDYIRNLTNANTAQGVLQLDTEAVLKSIEAQHGLLIERARGIYSFSHLTFHEYFTAQKIIASPNPKSLDKALHDLVNHVTEKRWREVFLLTVGMLPSAEYLLQLMKAKIDTLLEGDDKLQYLLIWVHNKSQSVEFLHKSNAIRAFYFAFVCTLTFNLNRVCNLKSARNKVLSRTHDLTHALVRDFIHDIDNALSRVLEQVNELTLALDLDLTLVLDHNFSLNSVLPFDIALAFDSELQHKLKGLKSQLPITPEYSSIKKLQQWWFANSRVMLEELTLLMLRCRDTEWDWQFSTEQKKQLKNYYEANKLLVSCLNSDCYVSREVREEIEETLLLPISEIERLKGEQ